ncbi:5478_t:CDS:2 [Entrophospora sp. SA101]|nr:5478_t:CDS:2 [Entrophospora sp. SA101]
MIQLISPNPNNVDSIDIPKTQNAFLLYRKNYAAKHKSLESKKDWKTLSKEAGYAWKNESDEVKRYFKILAKLAFEKHNLVYEKHKSVYESIIQVPKNYLFISQEQEAQKEQKENCNNNTISLFSTPFLPPPSTSYFPCTDDNLSSSYRQLEPQQIQIYDNNADYIDSSSHYLYTNYNSSFDNPSSLSFTFFNPSTSFLSYSTFNPLPINDDNFINNTNASSQTAKFNTTMDLNYDEILSKGSECLPDKQMNKRFKFKSVNF